MVFHYIHSKRILINLTIFHDIESDPSFERSHREEHHALYFEMEMSWGYANNYDYRLIFDRLFPILVF